MKFGIVIGTYGTPAYVALGLEAKKRFCPDVPALVHDDCSDAGDEVYGVCRRYGADYVTTQSRKGHQVGDLSAFLAGMQWARSRDLDVLVKFSRCYVPIFDWRESLEAVANGEAATFGNKDKMHPLLLRTEAVALRVREWFSRQAVDEIARATQQPSPAAEGLMLKLAAKASHRAPLAVWPAVSDNGFRPAAGFPTLWHLHSRANDYYELSASWGLPYGSERFGERFARSSR